MDISPFTSTKKKLKRCGKQKWISQSLHNVIFEFLPSALIILLTIRHRNQWRKLKIYCKQIISYIWISNNSKITQRKSHNSLFNSTDNFLVTIYSNKYFRENLSTPFLSQLIKYSLFQFIPKYLILTSSPPITFLSSNMLYALQM